MAPSSADHLALLYRVAQAFNSTLELEAVLNTVMDEVIAATRAERGFLLLHNAQGRLEPHIARGLEQRALDAPEFQVSRGLIERVAREGQPLLTSDAQSDAWLRQRASVMALRLRALLCVPLRLRDRILGVVYVDNRLQAGIFTSADLELLTAIAASAAVAIDNARLYALAVEKGRLERELQMARDVQASLLPRVVPALPGWTLAAHWQPAREVAGDYYDFLPGADTVGLVVGDVTDKGMPAALFMALTRSTVRACLTEASAPASGLAQANQLITADSADSMFVTLAYLRLTADQDEVACVSAGHNPVLIYRPQTGTFEALGRTGLPLGLDAEAVWDTHRVAVGAGDVVLLYTDGLTDALDAAEQSFGLERVQAVIAAQAAQAPAEIVAALAAALAEHIGAAAPYDDVTIVLAKRGQRYN